MAAAPSPLASSVEKTNGAKLSRLLIDGGTTVLRDVFDRYHPPGHLAAGLNANYLTLNTLKTRKVLHQPQWDLLFPPGGATPDSKTFDITLLFLLLTNICGLSPPLSGWHKPPPSSDTSLEANLTRIKLYRNELYGHVTSTGVQTAVFNIKWREISTFLVALGLNPVEVVRLKSAPCGEDYISAVMEWVKSDEGIKSKLGELSKNQREARQMQEEDHRTLQDTQVAVEGVRQIHKHTHDLIKEVLKTQQEGYKIQHEDHNTLQETQQTVEDVRRINEDTNQVLKEALETQQEVHLKQQETVETVRQTQLEDRDTLQDSKLKLQELHQIIQGAVKTQKEHFKASLAVSQAVRNLEKEREAEVEEQVLQNLAKSEFKGDIEYLVGQYQEGTREWVFNEVENWLDDRNSKNRVMVISSNAGMGKSVISAVICKRMLEAGRLSGSHFCQHNNARYRNPQLMLQSLACHLYHALPEYKQALVKQLTRNLGKDLNSMGVEELFALLFKEPLSTVADPGRNMLLVIDALDESDYQERNELLDVLANHLCKLPCWIRFLCTTRPERNIAEVLKHLKPFQLESNDDKNMEDIKHFIENRTQHLIEPEKKDTTVEKLVEKSEGLMLYAYFLVLFIEENKSVLEQEDIDDSLPLAISSVYHSYFKRLENELTKELGVNEDNFLNLLSAVIASREPMPVDFVFKLLGSNASSPLARRKVLKAISSVSSLLPIRDGCLQVIHKSVKDWLTDASCYGEHHFTMDKKNGHRILGSLCADELDDLKQKGVRDGPLSSTEKYALYHGVRHMLQLDENMGSGRLEECVQTYVIDLDLLYAKLCLNCSIAAEDISWLQSQDLCRALSENSKDVLKTLILLLRRYFSTFTDHPHVFVQTLLNEGGPVLSPMASNMLENKFLEMPYMEFVNKDTRQGAVLARFQCSSQVACFDVSPRLDYMVCECDDGMIHLWSLNTGKLVWERLTMIRKLFSTGAFRKPPSSPVFSIYRSVVFHPTADVVLPGVLSHAYDFNGDLKPLFLESNCNFTVCSIFRHKAMMLTDSPDDAKCILIWSLKDGSEIRRITTVEEVLSFAWSRDGKLLAISHCMGSISFVDVVDGFRTLAQTATPKVCGMIKFSTDCGTLFCCHLSLSDLKESLFRVKFNMTDPTFRLDVVESYIPWDFESSSEGGFMLGDPLSSSFDNSSLAVFDWKFDFVLNEQSVLRSSPRGICVNMLNINETRGTEKEGPLTNIKQSEFSLSGNTLYLVSDDGITMPTVSAWDVTNEKFIAKKTILLQKSMLIMNKRGLISISYLAAVKEGVVLSTTDDTVELWNFELSKCLRRWPQLFKIKHIVSMSAERVACVCQDKRTKVVIVLDTSQDKIMSKIQIGYGRLVSCNSKCQLLIYRNRSLQLHDGSKEVWYVDADFRFKDCTTLSIPSGLFSPAQQFIVTWLGRDMLVLDTVSGQVLHVLCRKDWVSNCKFVSDEVCVVSSEDCLGGYSLRLFNVKSGQLLSIIDLEREVQFLAACPRTRLLAINQRFPEHRFGFKFIQVHLLQHKGNRKSKR